MRSDSNAVLCLDSRALSSEVQAATLLARAALSGPKHLFLLWANIRCAWRIYRSARKMAEVTSRIERVSAGAAEQHTPWESSEIIHIGQSLLREIDELLEFVARHDEANLLLRLACRNLAARAMCMADLIEDLAMVESGDLDRAVEDAHRDSKNGDLVSLRDFMDTLPR